MNALQPKEQQLRKISTQPGFIAALDQSGGLAVRQQEVKGGGPRATPLFCYMASDDPAPGRGRTGRELVVCSWRRVAGGGRVKPR